MPVREVLDEAEVDGHDRPLLPGLMVDRLPRRPGGRTVVQLSVEPRRQVADRARGNKKGPREAPADRVERSTCLSGWSLTTRKHGATSDPALLAGDERRDRGSFQVAVSFHSKTSTTKHIRPGRLTSKYQMVTDLTTRRVISVSYDSHHDLVHRRPIGVGDVERRLHFLFDHFPDRVDQLQKAWRALDGEVARPRDVDVEDRFDLAWPRGHHHYAVRQIHRLVDLVGDEQHRLAVRTPDPQELRLHDLARLGIQP